MQNQGTEKQMKIPKIIPIIIGIILSILILYVGFTLLQGILTKASDVAPRDVTITEISNSSAKIRYTSGQETQGVIEYGTSPTALNFFSPESEQVRDHTIELTLLSPNSTYYFQIRIGENKYDNGGVPWSFSTLSTENSAKTVPSATPKTNPSGTQTSPQPTPIQRLRVSNSPPQIGTCQEKDCEKICKKIHEGNACTTQDFVRENCIGKVNLQTCAQNIPTATPTVSSTTPTLTPTPAVN